MYGFACIVSIYAWAIYGSVFYMFMCGLSFAWGLDQTVKSLKKGNIFYR